MRHEDGIRELGRDVAGEATNWITVAERYKSFRVDSGTVSEANYNTDEKYRIQRAVDIITARSGAAHDAGALLRLYSEKQPFWRTSRWFDPKLTMRFSAPSPLG